jgi:hypothetical protein
MRPIFRRIAVFAAIVASGGIPISGCETRFKEAVVGGTKDYVSATLSNPQTTAVVLDSLFPAQQPDWWDEP